MDFQYIKNIYDYHNEQLLDSTLTINATIHIKPVESATESVDYGDVLDGRVTEPVHRYYPENLNRFYRTQVYPIDKFSYSMANPMRQQKVGNIENWDFWISCFVSSVSHRNNSTYFDYADTVEIKGVKYSIRGVVKDSFGNKSMLHVLLAKETE